jgi:ABC-2 type transport system permease protein
VVEQVPRTVGAALVQLPAVWVLAGVAVALFGLLPRVAGGVAWGVLAWFVFVAFVGALLRLDQWALDLSPYTHIPKVPAGEVAAGPLLWLTVLAAVLVAAGLLGFRRRDVG